MKKMISAFLAVVMLCGSLTCSAVEPRASRYFSILTAVITPQGGNKMAVSYSVTATGSMTKLGAYSIRLEEEVGNDNWITSTTVYGSKNPSFYAYDTVSHAGSYTFTGIPGVKYRAVLVAYASNSSGSEYSNEIVSSGKVCR